MRPKLQLALDLKNIEHALSIVEETKSHIDIIEVGTILAIEEGMRSVRLIRAIAQDHTLLADIRIIKAGGKLAEQAFNAGANSVSLMSDASEETFENVMKQKNIANNRNVIVEINQTYTDEQLAYWRKLGITQIIYHRSSEVNDSEEEWNALDFEKIKKWHELGFEVFVTGGIEIDDIKLFAGVPVYCFIVGRSITASDNPSETSKLYQEEIGKYFS